MKKGQTIILTYPKKVRGVELIIEQDKHGWLTAGGLLLSTVILQNKPILKNSFYVL